MTQAATNSSGKGQPDLFPAAGPKKRDWEGMAAIYGKSVRSLKRYDQDGREAGDPCPLEDPVKFASWWQKHMKHQVPGWLLKARGAGAPAEVVPEAIEAPAAAPEPEEINLDVFEDEIGLDKALERLGKIEVQLSRSAHKPGQAAAWLNTITRMGTVAEKLRTEQERRRELIPKAEAEKMIHEFHEPIERETRNLARAMCEIVGLPFTPHIQEAWGKECDRLFTRLQQEVFR